MTILNPNFLELLRCLNSERVKYLVIGGYAVNFHGHHRNTSDFDIWIEVSIENAHRVSRALQAHGFGPAAVVPEQFLQIGMVFRFGRKPLLVDMLTQPSGVQFEECYQRRVEAEVNGILVPFISLEDLKANKRASGRTKDIGDVESLP